jgi:hypothetical protein
MRAPSKGKKVEREVWQVDSSSWEFLGKICSDQLLFGIRLELRNPNSNLNKPKTTKMREPYIVFCLSNWKFYITAGNARLNITNMVAIVIDNSNKNTTITQLD